MKVNRRSGEYPPLRGDLRLGVAPALLPAEILTRHHLEGGVIPEDEFPLWTAVSCGSQGRPGVREWVARFVPNRATSLH